MKLYSISTLVFLLLSGSLFGQFDGQNGQASFYTEVEQENRPSFLKMEEEAMLVERWQDAADKLGLQNVAIVEELDLDEIRNTLQMDWNAQFRLNQSINDYLEQLSTRNEQLRGLQSNMARMMLDLETENELYTDMGADLAEDEAEILEENRSEIGNISLELDNYQMEMERNDTEILVQIDRLLENETQLHELAEQQEAVSTLIAYQKHLQTVREMAVAK
jgi:hypothetical protein